MATSPNPRTSKTGNGAKATTEDLEADIARLREDISQLAKQVATTGEHTYEAARRAVGGGAEQLRLKGDAAMGSLRSNASDIEEQVTEAVREKPITALAIAAGVGYFLAMLSRR